MFSHKNLLLVFLILNILLFLKQLSREYHGTLQIDASLTWKPSPNCSEEANAIHHKDENSGSTSTKNTPAPSPEPTNAKKKSAQTLAPERNPRLSFSASGRVERVVTEPSSPDKQKSQRYTASAKIQREKSPADNNDVSTKPSNVMVNTYGGSTKSFTHGNVIYGHVHMAKTAGTEINGKLAARYERVCGHKGYSYDAYNHNYRGSAWKQRHPGKSLEPGFKIRDSFYRLAKGFNRGRVHISQMDEIGYHDCDWISHEGPVFLWHKVYNDIAPFEFPLELHIPCRQPIDHLLSMCNHQNITFRCDVSDDRLPEEVHKCLLIEAKRFKEKEFAVGRNGIASRKCFNPLPIDPYLDFMASRLQEKRIVAKYIRRDTNKARIKQLECLNTNMDVREKVEAFLMQNVSYFSFCNSCMGSKDDLLA